ncbi:hypothetical protein V5N11_005973 [Cardamine amara subsp. amara]|uniref:Retrotransposon gag domain-containing protein n=1 Tax=Cardamine amara subsp. amara TaxID=228776 RepID=A0ABD1BT34_CARAN
MEWLLSCRCFGMRWNRCGEIDKKFSNNSLVLETRIIHTPTTRTELPLCLQPFSQRQDFEIKPQMILLVKQHLFHGLPAEIPMDHIENFEEICSTTSSNGVPNEFLKCKLFLFSLADKASLWLKSLPPSSLKTWAECRASFLDHFYTKSKTASLRNKIS